MIPIKNAAVDLLDFPLHVRIGVARFRNGFRRGDLVNFSLRRGVRPFTDQRQGLDQLRQISSLRSKSAGEFVDPQTLAVEDSVEGLGDAIMSTIQFGCHCFDGVRFEFREFRGDDRRLFVDMGFYEVDDLLHFLVVHVLTQIRIHVFEVP